jgi:tetratricopeptide (TPR) repeat protein
MKIPTPMLGPPIFIAIADTLLLAGASVYSLKKTRVLFFSFFFFLVTLLPYLNIIPISTVLADRYVFIASFSYCFVLGVLYDRFYRLRSRKTSKEFFKVLSTVLFLFLLVGYSFIVIQQNKVWENSYTLWADAVHKQPESNTANAMMGVVYLQLGMDEEAVQYLEKAVHLFPIDYESRNNLGIVYGRMGHPERALRELLIADQLKPNHYPIRVNLSVHYMKQQDYGKALEILQDLVTKNPFDPALYFRLGMLYKEMGHYQAAVSNLLKSSELAPNVIYPYEELGNIYLRQFGDVARAKFYYSKAVAAAAPGEPKAERLRQLIQDLEAM